MKRLDLLVFGIFCIISLFIFKSYVIGGKVPIPFNLLVSYYSPWKYEPWSGYERGVPNKPLGFDNLKLFYPFRKFTTDQLKQRQVPLWNPYIFSGNVHLGAYQSAVFYPLSIVYFLLSQADAWSVLVLLQPVLSGFFTYLFLRSLLISRRASFFGASGFAFSGWMIAMWQEVLVLEHSILWLPLALWASNRIWDSKYKLGNMLLLILALTFSVFAGFLQMSIYLFITVLLWNAYRYMRCKDTRSRNRTLIFLVLGFVSSMLITGIQWIPGFEAYLYSPRGRVDVPFLFEQFLSPIHHLLTLVVPDFWGNPGAYNYFGPLRYIQERTIYVGLFVLILGLAEIVRRQKGAARFWKLFTLITFSLGLALPTGWIWYMLRVPILSVAQPARIFVLSTFGLCTLAAYGCDLFLGGNKRYETKHVFMIIGVLLALLWLFVLSVVGLSWFYRIFNVWCSATSYPLIDFFCHKLLYVYDRRTMELFSTVSLRNLVLPTLLAAAAWVVASRFPRNKNVLFVSICLISLVGPLYFANKIVYFSDRRFEFPTVAPITQLKNLSGLYRVWSYGDAYIYRNMLSYFQIYSPEGYDALYAHRYGELLYAIRTKGTFEKNIYRTDANFSEMGQNELFSTSPYRLRLMSLLGVKYVLEAKAVSSKDDPSPEVRFPSSLFSLAWQDQRWRIWEYTAVFPRAFFVHSYSVEKSEQKILDTLFDPSFNARKQIVLEDTPSFASYEDASADETSRVEITRYDPMTVELSVRAPTRGFVFLSDTYYPGWKAYVDGHEAVIHVADYSFRAVEVPQGDHKIRYSYQPMSFYLGVMVSVSGIVLLGVFSLWFMFRRVGKFAETHV